MSDGNVVRLPGLPATAHTPAPVVSADLFGSAEAVRGKVAFESINSLDEEQLLRIMLSNSVAAVVDLRPKSVFQKPKFNHKRIFDFLNRHKVYFVEYSMKISVDENEVEIWKNDLSRASTRGLVLCVFDDAAQERGSVARFKSDLHRVIGGWSEMHPNALAGRAK